MSDDKVTKFEVDRSEWLRSVPVGGTSCLLRGTDCKRCCIGFYVAALGVSDSMAIDTADPAELDAASKKTICDAGGSWLFGEDECSNKNSQDTNDLIFENDRSDVGLYGKLREDRIAKIFAKNGVAVTFIN